MTYPTYARRSQLTRPVYPINETEISDFFNAFPYQETEDQIKPPRVVGRSHCLKKSHGSPDLRSVGFGKTEIAMRASFIAATGKNRWPYWLPQQFSPCNITKPLQNVFKGWPLRIQVINRLQPSIRIKKTLKILPQGGGYSYWNSSSFKSGRGV